MALDTRIPLQTQVANPSRKLGSLANAIATRERMNLAQKQETRAQETFDLNKQQILQQIDSAGKTQSLTDMARDSVQIRSLLQSGDIEGARNFAINRVTSLNERRKAGENVNAIHTERFLQALEADPNQALKMLDNEISGLTQLGFIEPLPGARGQQNHVNAPVTLVKKDAEGNVVDKMLAFPTINKSTLEATLEPAQIPEGFELALETPEQKRAADVLANLEKITDKLEAEREIKPEIAADTKQSEAAVKKADELFEAIDKMNVNISNLQQARQAVLDGAGTGPIEQLWPSFRAESVRLDNMQGRLGLDIVGATTFGALSKGELDLSKSVALPTGLDGPELVKWIDDRIAAQQKKADYLQRQAVFLSEKTDGKQNTKADWAKAEKAALDRALEAFGATEDDIKATMAANNMDRSQVLAEIRRRFESGGS